jgi:hypothetical protein
VGVDHRGGVVDPIGVDLRRHQARSIAEGARIELRGELAHESLAFEALGALEDFLLRHVDELPEHGEWSRYQRNLTLQRAQQFPVPLIDILH